MDEVLGQSSTCLEGVVERIPNPVPDYTPPEDFFRKLCMTLPKEIPFELVLDKKPSEIDVGDMPTASRYVWDFKEPASVSEIIWCRLYFTSGDSSAFQVIYRFHGDCA
jgi:hypothetical protein